MAAVKTKRPTRAATSKLKAGKKKPLNKWVILGGAAAVVAIGVAVVRFSGASSYTFVNSPNKMYGGNWSARNELRTSDDVPKGERIGTLVSQAIMSKSRTVCARVRNLSKSRAYYGLVGGTKLGGDWNFGVVMIDAGKTENICAGRSGHPHFDNNTNLYVYSLETYGTGGKSAKPYGVYTFYGKP